jgi:hypothetical protein
MSAKKHDSHGSDAVPSGRAAPAGRSSLARLLEDPWRAGQSLLPLWPQEPPVVLRRCKAWRHAGAGPDDHPCLGAAKRLITGILVRGKQPHPIPASFPPGADSELQYFLPREAQYVAFGSSSMPISGLEALRSTFLEILRKN